MFGTAEKDAVGGVLADRRWSDLQASLTRYCLSLTRSPHDAEDLAQDTWLKALGTLQGLGHRNAEAYMLRIAKNAWIDRMRRQAREARLLRLEEPGFMEAPEGPFEAERLLGALALRMSPVQRAVFLLREVFGLTGAETASRLRMTEGAVKAALHRARDALAAVKEELAKEAPLPNDEGFRVYLRALAAAFQDGDIARLVALAQQDALPPVTAISLAGSMGRRRAQADSKPARLSMRLAVA